MKVHIVGGGPREFIPPLSTFHDKETLWIGVDRGTRYLIEAGIYPEIAVGDFDSISSEELRSYQEQLPAIVKHQPEKDETDMELALQQALHFKPSVIRIFGATGGRLDHFLANILLIAKFVEEQKNLKLELIDRQNLVEVKLPGEYIVEKLNYKYISFIPISSVVGLTLEGFKYSLTDAKVPRGSTLCVSNELIYDNGNFSFSEGILLVIRASDENNDNRLFS